MQSNPVKGRGAGLNPGNRFEKLHIEYEEPEEFLSEEFRDKKTETVFLRDNSKTIIAKNDSVDINFDYSINPYRGCEHGCVYCYARPSHEYLGFSSGLDFETNIMVKEDAAELLSETFKKKSYKPDLIALSGNTDCYQPVERKLKITRSVLQVCLNYRNPVSIVTKNTLVTRDIDILKQLAELNLASVTLSITTLDKELSRTMEPRTSTPERKLQAIEELAANNIPVGINIAPVIPGMNDEEIPAILKAASEHGAKSAGHLILRLPYQNKELFLEWLNRNYPARAGKIINRIKDLRGGKLSSSEWGKRFTGEGEIAEAIHKLFRISCEKYGINKHRLKLRNDLFRRNFSDQLDMFEGLQL